MEDNLQIKKETRALPKQNVGFIIKDLHSLLGRVPDIPDVITEKYAVYFSIIFR